MKKLVLFQFLLIVVAFFLVRDPFNYQTPPIAQTQLKKSKVYQLFDNYCSYGAHAL